MIRHDELKKLLPHRYPLLLVDRVVDLRRWDRVVGCKQVTGTEACYESVPDGAPPESYAYPSSLILESFGQVGGVLVNMKRREQKLPSDVIMLASGVMSFKYFAPVYPGDLMTHHLSLDKDMDDFAVLSGEVRVENRKVAEAEAMIVAYRKREDIRYHGG